jgi:hypothetical protein
MPLHTMPPLSSPQWDGGDPNGRHIILDHEQGLGDQLMCARFATAVAARGAEVTIRCSAPIAALLAALPGVTRVISAGDAVPTHDLHASLLSLPYLLGITDPGMLDGAPYLTPVGECPAGLHAVTCGTKPRVGLVWAGNPQHRNDARRSIRPALLHPLLTVDDVEFISLQRHAGDAGATADVPAGMTDAGGLLHTLNDTAHLLLRLDLLITVDTAVAHLAGALGVPTLVLVPFVPDWRWMTDRSDTPWYRTVTLLRQGTLFDWTPVIAAARTQVARLTTTTA